MTFSNATNSAGELAAQNDGLRVAWVSAVPDRDRDVVANLLDDDA